ncbi:MAG: hypothetical protein F6K48_18800 [Okeania sp. SIO3H1]|uniref:Pepco domain-containing protein n=1 Tax=Okeania sp. SIO1I7 TaxID=2607772 RepID=UPI0013CB05F9|nr:hypothetical protein [Okeania sp. SIO1I7]NEN90849.1 hypothetical protein [Okeania sp. SIO3H1]NET27631.1 hypothetical protein [Okeania sp. SIO1I7]
MKDNKIWIIGDETASKVSGEKDTVDTGSKYSNSSKESTESDRKRFQVKAEDLKREMSEFLKVIEDVFDQTDRETSNVKLKEIELSVEINGEGQVTLFGIGGKAGSKGAIKLKLERKES